MPFNPFCSKTLLKEDGTETRPFLSMRLMYVDRNNAILKKKLVIKIINKITSFGLNWDYLGYYGIIWVMSIPIYDISFIINYLTNIIH